MFIAITGFSGFLFPNSENCRNISIIDDACSEGKKYVYVCLSACLSACMYVSIYVGPKYYVCMYIYLCVCEHLCFCYNLVSYSLSICPFTLRLYFLMCLLVRLFVLWVF